MYITYIRIYIVIYIDMAVSIYSVAILAQAIFGQLFHHPQSHRCCLGGTLSRYALAHMANIIDIISALDRWPVAQAAFGTMLGVCNGPQSGRSLENLATSVARGVVQAARQAPLDVAVGTSHVSPESAAEGLHAVEGLDQVVALVKEVAGLPGVVPIEDAKLWMRKFGSRGRRAAGKLGKLSQLRNGQSHPITRQLLLEVRQLAKLDMCDEEATTDTALGEHVSAPGVDSKAKVKIDLFSQLHNSYQVMFALRRCL